MDFVIKRWRLGIEENDRQRLSAAASSFELPRHFEYTHPPKEWLAKQWGLGNYSDNRFAGTPQILVLVLDDLCVDEIGKAIPFRVKRSRRSVTS
jgi:hypothetical protein